MGKKRLHLHYVKLQINRYFVWPIIYVAWFCFQGGAHMHYMYPFIRHFNPKVTYWNVRSGHTFVHYTKKTRLPVSELRLMLWLLFFSVARAVLESRELLRIDLIFQNV